MTTGIEPKYLPMYPAVAVQILDSTPNEHGGMTINSCKLLSIGLSIGPNANPNIDTLQNQYNNKNNEK